MDYKKFRDMLELTKYVSSKQIDYLWTNKDSCVVFFNSECKTINSIKNVLTKFGVPMFFNNLTPEDFKGIGLAEKYTNRNANFIVKYGDLSIEDLYIELFRSGELPFKISKPKQTESEKIIVVDYIKNVEIK